MTLEQDLRFHIVSVYLPGEDPEVLPLEENLIDSGVLDSIALMNLVAYLQDRYRIQIPARDITQETFATVGSVATYIRSKAPGAAQQPNSTS